MAAFQWRAVAVLRELVEGLHEVLHRRQWMDGGLLDFLFLGECDRRGLHPFGAIQLLEQVVALGSHPGELRARVGEASHRLFPTVAERHEPLLLIGQLLFRRLVAACGRFEAVVEACLEPFDLCAELLEPGA